MNGPKIVENIFFTVTCLSVFTCVIRSDYNFAMGLLCYYMIKNINSKQGNEISKVARTVSTLTKQVHTRQNNLSYATIAFAKTDTIDYSTPLPIGDLTLRADHCHGHPMDLRHARGLGRQAP